jgi:hypothetical protein
MAVAARTAEGFILSLKCLLLSAKAPANLMRKLHLVDDSCDEKSLSRPLRKNTH